MRMHEFEAWVLDVADLVGSGAPNEDSRVELKRDWIAPEKAARRIAGHANAARGAEILWVIGLDPRATPGKGPVGATDEDLATWWDQVASHFDGRPPSIESRVVRVGEKAVVGLLMDTTTAPFVIRNPGPGPDLEVPWRENTRIRSARREDLIRLLSPLRSRPSFEVLGAHVQFSAGPGDPYLAFKALLFMDRLLDSPAVIPFHRSSVNVRLGGLDVELERLDLIPRFHGRQHSQFGTLIRGSLASVEEPRGQVTIAQPLQVTATASVAAELDVEALSELKEVHARLDLHVMELENPVVVDVVMAGPENVQDEGYPTGHVGLVWRPEGLPRVSPYD